MNKPNFQAMNRKELQAYVLAHRDDDKAFQAYVDKLHAEANWTEHPPLTSVEDLKNYPNLTKKLRQDSGQM